MARPRLRESPWQQHVVNQWRQSVGNCNKNTWCPEQSVSFIQLFTLTHWLTGRAKLGRCHHKQFSNHSERLIHFSRILSLHHIRRHVQAILLNDGILRTTYTIPRHHLSGEICTGIYVEWELVNCTKTCSNTITVWQHRLDNFSTFSRSTATQTNQWPCNA